MSFNELVSPDYALERDLFPPIRGMVETPANRKALLTNRQSGP